MLERQGVDVIIVGRGGGSIEDLWAFNEEIVARAIFDCTVPVISAVGHETDTTIADYVADLRAPTPSAAAELAVYDFRQVQSWMQETDLKLKRLLGQKIQLARMQLRQYVTRLKVLHPRYQLQERQQLLVEYEERLNRCMEGKIQKERHRLALYIEKMKGLSPLKKLNLGYAYVEDEKGNSVRSVQQVHKGSALSVHVTDGVIYTSVTGFKEEEHGEE